MSRDIKFRGKRVDNSELVYGHYVKYEHIGVVKCFIVMNWAQIYVNSHEIDSETVGQFTGLKDKNGVDIYEGDIVHFKSNGLSGYGVVYYDEYTAKFRVKDNRRKNTRYYEFYRDSVYRIDGNIYENPNLSAGDNT